MGHNECPFAMDEEGLCDSVGMRARKGRVWISVVGLFLSLLSLLIVLPWFLPEPLFSVRSPSFRTLMFWTFYTTPPLVLVANAITVCYGRWKVFGVIGLLFSVSACVVWALGVFVWLCWIL
jgi:hypothetical protein